MRIIAGIARNMELTVPAGMAVRPTAGRSRKALFDSIGPAVIDADVLDLCAGSGALGLEAASRGAASVALVENNPRHIDAIEANISGIRKTGVQTAFAVIPAGVESVHTWLGRCPAADLIFADPPYADSVRIFREILGNGAFRKQYAGARLIWELPDVPGGIGPFLKSGFLAGESVRQFGGANFLLGEVLP